MSECPSLMKRTLGALAGVAVDAARDLTVSRLDVLAHQLHQRLSTLPTPPNIPNPSESPENDDSAPDNNKTSSETLPPAILTGALIGIGIALLISMKR